MKHTIITMVTRLIALNSCSLLKPCTFVKETTADDLGAGQLLFRNLNMSQPMVFLLLVV